MSDTSKRIRVTVNDDHDVFRSGLVSMLNGSQHFELITAVSDISNPVAHAAAHEPDVIFLSIRVIQSDTNRTINAYAQVHPRVKIIAISGDINAQDLLDATHAGAKGYLSRSASREDVFTAIRTVANDETYCPVSVGYHMASLISGKGFHALLNKETSLSVNERLFIQMACMGMTLKEIAHKCNLTTRAIEARKHSVYRKTEARNIVELMNYAIKHGLFNPFAPNKLPF